MSRYHRPLSNTWWLQRTFYIVFILRELTALFVAFYAIVLLSIIHALGSGREAYESMLMLLRAPAMIALHVVALAFVCFHSITWFNLTPKAVVVQVGEERVPAAIIAGANYVAWIVLSVIIAWIIIKA